MGTPAQLAGQQTQPASRLSHDSALRQCYRGNPKVQARLVALFICTCIAGFANADIAAAQSFSQTAALSPLVDQYHLLKDELAKSIFGSPILLSSEIGDGHAKGEVYALLDTPFDALNKALSQPAQWCALAILHVNIKTCTYLDDQVQLFVGRKDYQTPDEAFPLRYRFTQQTNEHQLSVQLTAPTGPFGTSDYLISLEATPIDDQHSFIHFQYHYQFGFMAKMAMQTYLATLGRNKVGFTIVDTDENGNAIYIKGLQGVIERNVMRYIFAIQSVLEGRKSPNKNRLTEQLVQWYGHIQEHPRQLVELTREEYMDNKQREHSNQQKAQKALRP